MMPTLLNHQTALYQLSRIPVNLDLNERLKMMIRQVAETMECEQVSFWLFDEKRNSITTTCIYHLSSNEFLAGKSFLNRDYPNYFNALGKNTGMIVADDAISNPSTSEFADNYLIPLGIVSMLDVPIRIGNRMLGILCLEHVGMIRHWTENEQLFARAVADLAALIFESEERKEVENKLVQSEQQIRSFAKHLNHVLEDERARIAREIHDELGQQLAGFKIGLTVLKKEGKGNTRLEEKIETMISNTNDTIQSLRRIATELRPGILDSLGLIPSIQWLAQEFKKKNGIRCTVVLDVQTERFEEKISTGLFRICQEALTNISKHAHASEVIISISQDGEFLTLRITDNGRGISSEKLVNPYSMGLLGMRERANLIEADLKIDSKLGSGTTIQLKAKIN